jgi:hypothetical protein
MRALMIRASILGIAMAGVAGAAVAQFTDAPNGSIRMEKPQAAPSSGARKQAEDAVRHSLTDPDAALFRSENVKVADSARHGMFSEPVSGVSIVCGQYSTRAPGGGAAYSWFFVAVKHEQVLWADIDQAADGPGAAYSGCKGAGMAE